LHILYQDGNWAGVDGNGFMDGLLGRRWKAGMGCYIRTDAGKRIGLFMRNGLAKPVLDVAMLILSRAPSLCVILQGERDISYECSENIHLVIDTIV
jgi:hypothetical protein